MFVSANEGGRSEKLHISQFTQKPTVWGSIIYCDFKRKRYQNVKYEASA